MSLLKNVHPCLIMSRITLAALALTLLLHFGFKGGGNPVSDYARGKGLEDELIDILEPLGGDSRLDSSDKELIDALATLSLDRRGSSDLLKDLERIVADGKVSRDEFSFFKDKYVSPDAPAIKGLKWIPSKVVNEKVYEVTVTFKAEAITCCSSVLEAVKLLEGELKG